MTTKIEYASKDIRIFATALPEALQEIEFPSTGPDFYDYECELKAVWKVWHKEPRND